MSGGRRGRAAGAVPGSDHSTATAIGFLCRLRYHPRVLAGPRLVRVLRGGHVHGRGRTQRRPGLRDRRNAAPRTVPGRNRRAGRNFASRTSPSAWPACSVPKGPTRMGWIRTTSCRPVTTVQNRIGGTAAARSGGECSENSRPRRLGGQHAEQPVIPGSSRCTPRGRRASRPIPQMTRFASVDHDVCQGGLRRRDSRGAWSRSPALLRENATGIAPDEPDDFRVNDMAEASKAMASHPAISGQ